MTEQKTAIVFGAAGGMGRMFLERLGSAGYAAQGFDLVEAEGVSRADIFNLSPNLQDGLGKADMVILSVPDGVACKAAGSIAALLPQDSLLVDCTSVKAPYVEGLGKAGTCALVSINPLFGPGLDWQGRSIVVTELRAGPSVQQLRTFLDAFSMKVIDLEADRHDALAAEAQAQLHAAILAFSLSASKDGAVFDTPPHKVMRMLGARILTGEPEVYWKIQTSNPFADKARQALARALSEFSAAIMAADFEAFSGLLTEAKANLGDDPEALSEACKDLFSHV